jgi:tungstate transport system substrate-binding protein
MLRMLCRLLLILWALDAGAAERLRLATTTSTQDSGLLAVLNPAFEAASGIAVDVIAIGSGKALALARNGDVDVVLAHDPNAEETFIADGAGVDRRPVMTNDFVLVGPPTDPAGVRAATSAPDALARIARAEAAFVSRGDQSGTHVKELALFAAAQVQPAGRWYLAAGQGMGPVLQIADEMPAYTLADRGTWLARRAGLGLVLLYAGDRALLNPYHVMRVNPARHPHVRVDAARAYADFLTGARGQALIGGFLIDGEALFKPVASP